MDRYIVSVSDYSVQVTNLPEDVTEDAVKKHFETVTGAKVAEVSLARDCASLVQLFINRGKVVKKLEVVEDTMAMYKANGNKQRATHKLMKVRLKLLASLSTIKRLQHRVSPGDKVMAAFVTFEEEGGVLTCRDRYPNTFVSRLFQHHWLRLRNMRLQVDAAPDPSTILWENLGTRGTERLCRRAVTSFLSLLLVFGSFCFLVWASYSQAEAEEEGGVNQCPDAAVTQAQAQADPSVLHCYCETLSSAEAASDPACESWFQEQAVALLLSMLASSSVVIVNQLLNMLMKKLSEWLLVLVLVLVLLLVLALVLVSESVSVLVLVLVLRRVCVHQPHAGCLCFLGERLAAKFEKHSSMDTREKSLARRLFRVQFINTAIVVLLANAYITGTSFVEGQRYKDMETDWCALLVERSVGDCFFVCACINVRLFISPPRYLTVGGSIIFTMLLNILTPHIAPMLRALRLLCRRRCAKPVSQRQVRRRLPRARFS